MKRATVVKYYQWYGETSTPEEIDREKVFAILRRRYPHLTDERITELLPTKRLHLNSTLYWSENKKGAIV